MAQISKLTYGPRHDKTVFGVSVKEELKPASSATETSWNIKIWLVASVRMYDTFKSENNKGSDQTGGMCRLVCAFVVCKTKKTSFLTSRPI